MEGTLLKWTNYLFGWRERYFVIKGSICYYYIKKGDKPKGRIHLGICQINSTDDTKFELDTGINVVYMKAENKELRDEWVKALKSAKREAENKIQNEKNNIGVNLLNNSLNNVGNSIRLENNPLEFSTSRNSIMTEDKLLKKINTMHNGVEKIMRNNEKFGNIFNNNNGINNEFREIYNSYKVILVFYENFLILKFFTKLKKIILFL
jgi:hypothetical protein